MARGRTLNLVIKMAVVAAYLRLPDFRDDVTIGQHIHFLPLGDDDVGGGFRIAVTAVHQGMNQAVRNIGLDLRCRLVACRSETVTPQRMGRIDGEIELQDLIDLLQGSHTVLSPGRGRRLVQQRGGLVSKGIPLICIGVGRAQNREIDGFVARGCPFCQIGIFRLKLFTGREGRRRLGARQGPVTERMTAANVVIPIGVEVIGSEFYDARKSRKYQECSIAPSASIFPLKASVPRGLRVCPWNVLPDRVNVMINVRLHSPCGGISATQLPSKLPPRAGAGLTANITATIRSIIFSSCMGSFRFRFFGGDTLESISRVPSSVSLMSCPLRFADVCDRLFG